MEWYHTSCIVWIEQHSPFGLMVARLGNATITYTAIHVLQLCNYPSSMNALLEKNLVGDNLPLKTIKALHSLLLQKDSYTICSKQIAR